MTLTSRQIAIKNLHNMDALTVAELTAMADRLMASAAADRELNSHIVAGAKTTIAWTAQAVAAAR